MGMFLFLLCAFRPGDSVNDYAAYVEMYKNTFKWNIEFSFTIIAWLVKHILGDNILFLFIIYAILGITIKFVAIRELTTLYFLSLAIYISDIYILHELTQIRVGVAAGFMLLCIKPIYEKNWGKFLVFSTCAIFFHTSALLILPLWFLTSHSINKYVYASIIPIGYIFYFSQINLVEMAISLIPIDYIHQKFEFYKHIQQNTKKFNEINVFNYVFLAKISIYYLLLWKERLLSRYNRYVVILLKIQAIALTSFVFFASMPTFSFRITELLGIVEIVTIPMMIYIIKPKWVGKICVVGVAFIVLLINIFYVGLIIR